MPLPSKHTVLLSLVTVLALPPRGAHAQSVTPEVHSPTAPATEPDEGPSRQTIGWIIAGVGGASLLGSGYMVLLGNRKQDDMHGATGAETVKELQPYQTAATALFIVGVTGIAVGLPLALIGESDTQVVVSADRVMVSGSF